MGKPFTPERLASIRRMRKARRLHKQQPLFAYHILCEIYPAYSYSDFLEDLRYRRPPKRRKGKNNLQRYGRYARMNQYLETYKCTCNADDALQAIRLRQCLTKPYRVMVKVGKYNWEYSFSPLIPIQYIEELVGRLTKYCTETEVNNIVENFKKTTNLY